MKYTTTTIKITSTTISKISPKTNATISTTITTIILLEKGH